MSYFYLYVLTCFRASRTDHASHASALRCLHAPSAAMLMQLPASSCSFMACRGIGCVPCQYDISRCCCCLICHQCICVHGYPFTRLVAEIHELAHEDFTCRIVRSFPLAYREFHQGMQERARLQAQGAPDGAVPSLAAVKASVDRLPAYRMAADGSISEHVARAQEQMAVALDLDRIPPPYSDGFMADALPESSGEFQSQCMHAPQKAAKLGFVWICVQLYHYLPIWMMCMQGLSFEQTLTECNMHALQQRIYLCQDICSLA